MIARYDYSGQLQGTPAAAVCAITERQGDYYLMAKTSAAAKKNEWTDDALAMLDSIRVAPLARNRPMERAISVHGGWVIPSSSGNSFTTYHFGLDGTYAYHSESSYSGSSKNQYGDVTSSYGTSGNSSERGRYECWSDEIRFWPQGKPREIYKISTWKNGGKVYLKVGGQTFVR